MSEENDTDNPYQPPSLSDEPLVNQEVARPKATLTPVHVLLPGLGYAYVPAIFVFRHLLITPGRKSDIATLNNIVETLFECIFVKTHAPSSCSVLRRMRT